MIFAAEMLRCLDVSIRQKVRRPLLDLSEQLLTAPEEYYITLELILHHNYVRRWTLSVMKFRLPSSCAALHPGPMVHLKCLRIES